MLPGSAPWAERKACRSCRLQPPGGAGESSTDGCGPGLLAGQEDWRAPGFLRQVTHREEE